MQIETKVKLNSDSQQGSFREEKGYQGFFEK